MRNKYLTKERVDKQPFPCYNRYRKKREGNKTMKYRVYNEQNIDTARGMIFAHYTTTKKAAKEHGEKIGGNYIIERNVCGNWVKC